MARKGQQLAKLTRPRLHKAVARERLFALLDEAHEHKPAICVVGPPGAGKTTLVASWLDARGIKGIWYQVDPGDADLATFFYYLGEAAKTFTRTGQRPLPALTPEYLPDVEGFARRFFRELFARLPKGAALVLDNYQEVVPEQQFHQYLAQAGDEVPGGMVLIVISRRDPPDAYARLVANENVQLVEWDALKLTLEEARAIAGFRAHLKDEDLGRLFERSGGWAAGFTLLLEGSRRDEGLAPGAGAGRDALFDYFAAQIFAKIPRMAQEFLVATAYLPQVPVSIARELTGNADTETILEDLYRRHLFTHRRSGDEPVYWYHALFREFLLAQAGRYWSEEQRRKLQCRAGQLLDARGHLEAAFDLLCQACAWQAAEALILRQASWLLGQGRGETLRGWIVMLPKACVDANAWLRYWLGVSLVQVDQIQARAQLEDAFAAFRKSGDTLGQMRSISSIIDTFFFEWSHWQPLDRWIEALEPLMLASPTYPSGEIEFDIHCSMLIATLYRRPGHALLQVCVERVTALLESDLDVNRKVVGATLLLTFYNLASRLDFGQHIVAIAQPLLKQPGVTPLSRVWWCSRISFFLNARGDHEAVRARTQEAGDIIEAHGLKGLSGATVVVEWHLGWAVMAMKQWDEANRVVQRLEQLARKSRPSDLLLVTEAKLRLAMCRGDLGWALREAPRAVEAANAAGMIYLQVKLLASAVEVFAEAGKYAQARAHAALAYEIVRGTCLEYWEAEIRIIEAYNEHRGGNMDRCRTLLQEGFSQAARLHPIWQNAGLSGRVLVAMCAEALDAGIEVGYVKALIRRFRLPPPVNRGDAWPWRTKVYALGGYEVYRDDERLEFAGKVPKKPLMLLKALIAFGGRNVPEERLMDALWPDEEADAARKSLDITVLRLRKLLGNNETIVVSDELIGLNPQLCWTDVWAFERRIEQFEGSEEQAGAASEALRLYRGNFLPTYTDEPWTAKMRERLRSKFVRLVEAVALADENAGRWEQAIALYSKGLEADDLVEPFYQGLMRCYRSLGRHAEAMNAFRRLRQLLSVVLGIAPSESTQAMARALQRDNPAQFESS
jgi:LuxR family transcriptional regulator, maltose regulon positive regulatory protein